MSKRNVCVSLIALTCACAAATQGMAAGVDPLVIPGVGPEAAAPMPQRHGRRAAVVAAPPVAHQGGVQFVPGTRGTGGQYGGGFIELLMTGSTPSSPRTVHYNHPQAVAVPAPRAAVQVPAPVAAPRQAGPVYAAVPQAAIPQAVAPVQRAISPQFLRQDVEYRGAHGPGTIVVDTPNRFLYLVTAPGRATRYGIGVGRPGFEWAGVKSVTRKAEWPDWRPPSEMLRCRPDLPTFMAGGPENPLGARALYLGSSLYRIHGTNEPHTIGQNVSSGCIRMMNEDVIDLYNRVRVGAKVVVM